MTGGWTASNCRGVSAILARPYRYPVNDSSAASPPSARETHSRVDVTKGAASTRVTVDSRAKEAPKLVGNTLIELRYLPCDRPEPSPAKRWWRNLLRALDDRLSDTLDERWEPAPTSRRHRVPAVFIYLCLQIPGNGPRFRDRMGKPSELPDVRISSGPTIAWPRVRELETVRVPVSRS